MQLSAVAVGLREMRSTEIKLRTEENSTSGSRDLNEKKKELPELPCLGPIPPNTHTTMLLSVLVKLCCIAQI